MTTFGEFLVRFPELGNLTLYTEKSDFFFSIHEALTSGRGTDRQAEAGAKAIRRERERAQERENQDQALRDAGVTLPTGRATVTGEIVSARLKDTAYGTQLKLTVRSDDGYTVWGSAPSPITVPHGGCDELKGARIEFTATVSPAEPGGLFGFFKRPKLGTFNGPPSSLAVLDSDGTYPVRDRLSE